MMPNQPKKKAKITRRQFLIGAGVTGGALMLGAYLGLPAARLGVAEMLGESEQPVNAPKDPNVWFEITPENQVRLHLPKIEMGQGVFTALAQIAAEDLEAAWEQLEVVNASTARGFASGLMLTSGSSTISGLYQPLRETGALLKQMLVTEAAVQLGVAASALSVADGVISVTANPAQKLTFGEVVQKKTTAWELPKETPPLKPDTEFRLIGQPLPRLDLSEKVQGQTIYGFDMRVENMLYGAVARPPRFNAKMESAQAGDAPNKPGIVAVVTDSDFAGVAAETRTQAFAGLASLNVKWSAGDNTQQAEIEALVTVRPGQGQLIQVEGNVDANWNGEVLTAEYRTPMAVHAHLEPQAALVEIQGEKVYVWTSTQAAGQVREAVAKALNRQLENVIVTATYLGGGFGRRTTGEVAVEAARLAAKAGRPVQVAWTRGDEFRQGALRPPTHHVLKGAVQNGQMVALEHQQASGHVFPAVVSTLLGADFGAYRGAQIRYAIPHRRASAQPVNLPVKTTFWRGLGLLANTFALESFMDELAHLAQADPFDFRLRHLPAGELGSRTERVLTTLRERSGWDTAPAAGRARGLAMSVDVNTVVAQTAEVSIENGQIRVHQFISVIDCGLVINPNIAAQQTEGAIVMGLSSTLKEKITVKDGNIEATNFDAYPLLTIKEVPTLETHFLPATGKPLGMGEPPIGPVAAAVANAVFKLSGKRLRELPLKIE